MGRLHIMAAEWKYNKKYIHSKKQFIIQLNDDGIIVEIICKLTSLSDTNTITNEQASAQARRVKAQRLQTAMLDSLKGIRGFDVVWLQRAIKKATLKSIDKSS